MTARPIEAPSYAGMRPGEGQKAFLTALRLQAEGYKAAARYQIELLNFLKHRLERDVRLVEDLLANDTFADAIDVFAGFMQNAAAEYVSEASRLVSIGSKLGSETDRRMRRQADELVEDMAARTVA